MAAGDTCTADATGRGTEAVDALKTRNDGLPLPSDKETVASFLTTWVEGQRHRLRPGTWRRYEQYVRVHAIPVVGRVPLAKLGPHHLEKLYEDRLAAGLSPTTVHHLHTALHRAFSQAVRWGLLVRNPSDLVDSHASSGARWPCCQRSRSSNSSVPPPAARGAAHHRHHHGDAPRRDPRPAVARRRSRPWRAVGRRSPPEGPRRLLGHHPAEDTPVTPPDRAVGDGHRPIARDRRKQTEQRLLLGAEWTAGDLVFPSAIGRPQEGRNLVYGQLHPLLRGAGLPVIRFHDLRHTAATLMLSRGIHPKIVSEMLGHSTIGITLDLYSHVTPTMQRRRRSNGRPPALSRLVGSTTGRGPHPDTSSKSSAWAAPCAVSARARVGRMVER